MAFGYALPEQELEQLLGFSIFDKVLLSLLCRTLCVGVYLHQKIIGTAIQLDPNARGYYFLNK